MVQSPKRILIIAGEPSGDLRAAGLVRALLSINPHLSISGVGGEKMKEAGVKCFADINDLAVVGFVEVIKHFSRIKRIFHLVLEKVQSTKPDCVILVDYPGFNLRLAAELKKRGVKVIYYISPQVWAWKEKRVTTIKKVVDRMLVIFKFEESFYSKYQMNVDYVGHPLVDEIQITQTQKEVLKSLGLKFNPSENIESQIVLPFAPHRSTSKDIITVGLLPGSRQAEVEKHLPILVQTAENLYIQNQNFQFIILKSSILPLILFERAIAHCRFPIKISTLNFYDSLNAVDICIVASGTATLETALLQKPMVVIYKTSFITWALAKTFLKIPYIGLVNVVAGKQIVPEFIQNQAQPEMIAQEILSMLSDKKKLDILRSELIKVKEFLGEPGASRRAAEIVIKMVNG